MPDFGFDDWMDDQLRNVPVPRDLEARLRDIAGPSTGRETARPQLSPSDARIDRTLRSVELPRALPARLRTIARPKILTAWRRVPRDMWAAAASVLIFAGAGASLALWNMEPAAPPVAQTDAAPPRVSAPTQPSAQALAAGPNTEHGRHSLPGKRRTPPKRQTPVTIALNNQPQQSGSLAENMNALGSSLRQAIEAQKRAKFALGSSGQFEPLPDLAMLEAPVARGIAPPRSRGYDLLFQLRHGKHPLVSPAADPSLETSQAPLTLRTASYDRAAARVAAGRLPVKQDILVEDFLAAQDYQLPVAPAGSIGIHAGACPAPLGEANRHLLQVLVHGAELPERNRPAMRLIAVVDTSNSMTADARARQVTRALGRLGRHMRAGDRFTLIGFADSPRMLLENASGADLMMLTASGGLEPSGGRGDLLSAIQAAADAVSSSPAAEKRRVVFVSAGNELVGQRRAAARDALAKIAATGTSWSLIELRSHDDQSPWQDLATESRGQTIVCQSGDELLATCLEALEGRSTRLAQNLSLRIHFNPKQVAAYRLLGHEAATLTGNAGDPLEVTLHAGQTPTCMYELALNPPEQTKKGPAPVNLGTVEVTWRHPTTGQPQRRVLQLGPERLSPSFTAAPAWLQQGVIAARAAESLKGSYFANGTRRISQILEYAQRVQPQAAQTPEFRELVRLIQQADRLR
jgi:Ca-activated chloride channel family protein